MLDVSGVSRYAPPYLVVRALQIFVDVFPGEPKQLLVVGAP